MTDRRPKLLHDIRNCGLAIQAFVQGRTRADYEQNLMFRSAVERQFEIIGEATRRLTVVDAAFAVRIDQSSDIISFRNMIAHGYDVLDNSIVWGVIEDDLPRLMTSVNTLLAELEPKP